MSDAFSSDARLDVGRVIGRTFGVIGRNLASIALLSVGVSALTIGLAYLAGRGLAGMVGTPLITLAGALIGFVTQGFLVSCLTQIVVTDLNGSPGGIGSALGVGLRKMAPVAVLNLVYGIAVGLGSLLLLVPGLMLLVRWVVIVPAQVVEDRGFGGTLSRSSELAAGNRWRIFGLVMIYAVLLALLGVGRVFVAGGLSGFGERGGGFGTTLVVSQIVTSSITAAIGSAGVAALYTELRRIKEGAMPSQLAAVFA